ncbi:SMP-30/gluconolactonase/LRE family protein [Noviherbaspirillum sedimenti]|uniref:SMP-30/gluconolactonase/LRE family protein n=1 Tax=Noviherbaspirillum sedimenti TaxID=2320865 RepID=A0A3A3G667_9BURK|nr:SMP-30/gluconolactonase/LRE family protein [Noviherbaspirillum sedimenti]RJG03314.1 SMP-30/gluconolactonase/LRE family protein [Noviherbaspirillum sedimenti]
MDISPLGTSAESALFYTNATRGLTPIPASERDLPTVTAEPYFKVSDGLVALEGPAYDRQGNLLFVDVYCGRILRLSPDHTLTTLYTDSALHPAGIAIHKDGRIFVAGIGDSRAGSVIALDSDGGNPQTILPASAGYVPDDLVFDSKGGFYFTDFKGTSTNPAGGVFHVSPDFKTITPVLPNMSAANGVALSSDGKVLWATEFCASRLHRVDLEDEATVARFGTTIPYHFVGRAPDSMRTDADGNVYVAMFHQGRILVFSPYGIPIGQILLPGREENHFLKSTSLAFVPGSRDIVIVARDELGGRGSMIFRARGLTQGVTLLSHR